MGGGRGPAAIIEASPTQGDAPLTVRFDGSRSVERASAIIRFEWHFGDGESAQGPKVSHTYTRNGMYLVTLIVTDQLGASDRDRVRIVVGNPPPQPIITASPASGWAPLRVNFDGSPSFDPEGDEITSFEWDFGDGESAMGVRAVHEYAAAGRYQVRLTISDVEGATAGATLVVNALDFAKLEEGPSGLGLGQTPIDVLLRDFDGNGALDVAAADSESNEISILFGQVEPGAFTRRVALQAGIRPVALASGDFNGDGLLDLVAANLESGGISFYLNQGFRRFTGEDDMRFVRAASDVSVLDFDGDGNLDVAVTDPISHEVAVLPGDGAGGLHRERLKSVPVGRWPAALEAGDFNGDGRADLAVANFLGDSLSLLHGDGGGSFREGRVFRSVGRGPSALVSHDINGDDRLDLMVASAKDGTVSIFRGSESAQGLVATGSFSVGAGARSLAVADFDTDGIVDLAVAEGAARTVSVFLNDGSRLFRFPDGRSYSAQGSSSALAAGDLDRNGSPDLVIVRSDQVRLLVLFNRL